MDSLDLPNYGSELRGRYTIRLLLICQEGLEVGSSSVNNLGEGSA